MTKPTGFPIGRPRKGEHRPLTLKIISQRASRARSKLKPGWLEKQAERQRNWVAANYEKDRARRRRQAARNKAWANCGGEVTMYNTQPRAHLIG